MLRVAVPANKDHSESRASAGGSNLVSKAAARMTPTGFGRGYVPPEASGRIELNHLLDDVGRKALEDEQLSFLQ